MMKRLLLVLGLLGASLSFAALPTNQSHNWEINFPEFAYIWINIGDLSFDFSQETVDSTSTVGNLSNADYDSTVNPEVFAPDLEGLLSCIFGNSVDLSTTDSFPPNQQYDGDTAPASSKTCRFAPVIGTGGSSYTAEYKDPDTNDFDNTADADLLIFSSVENWQVDVEIDASSAVPTGISLEFYPYTWDNDEFKLEDKNGNNPTLGSSAIVLDQTNTAEVLSSGATNKGYYVQDLYWFYLQPVNFAMQANLGSISVPVNATIQVNYTFSAP